MHPRLLDPQNHETTRRAPDDFHLDEIKKLRAESEKLEAYWILMEQGKASSAEFKQSLKDIAGPVLDAGWS